MDLPYLVGSLAHHVNGFGSIPNFPHLSLLIISLHYEKMYIKLQNKSDIKVSIMNAKFLLMICNNVKANFMYATNLCQLICCSFFDQCLISERCLS